MKNKNLLKNSCLLNPDIRLDDIKDCKFCSYNCENVCPCDQFKCVCCKDKSEFKKFKTFSNSQPFGERYHKVKPLLSARVNLALAMFSCSEPKVSNYLTKVYDSLTSYVENFK